jgi:hypothetical protein
VGDFGGENGYMRRILEGNETNGGNYPFCGILEGNETNGGNYPSCRRYRGPAQCFARFCFVWSHRARLKKSGMAWARRMDESPNPAKTRNRGRGWAEYRRPDEKMSCRGPTQGYG